MDYTPVIPAVKKPRQEGLSKFKTSQDYIVKTLLGKRGKVVIYHPECHSPGNLRGRTVVAPASARFLLSAFEEEEM